MKDVDREIAQIVESINIPSKDQELMAGAIYQNLKMRIGLQLSSSSDSEMIRKIIKAFDNGDMDQIERYVSDRLISAILSDIRQEIGRP